jgi:hypothetical protein
VPVLASKTEDMNEGLAWLVTAHSHMGRGCISRHIDPHPVALAGEFERRRFGEQGHPALGHRIERVARRTDEPGDRRQIDDSAALRAVRSALAQRRQRQFGAEKDAGQVDRAQPVPLIEARLLDALAEKDAGIVDQDVEPAKAAGDGGDRRGPVGFAGHVETGVQHVAADGAGGLPARFVQHVADRDFGPRFGHQPRRLCTDPARRAGNQRDLAVESVHCLSSR